MERMVLCANPEDAGRRVDQFVADGSNTLTRSAVQRLCGEGYILVAGNPVGKNYKLRGDEMVEVVLPPAKQLEAQPQEIPLSIVYEDKDLIVVDKPKGMVVHPAAGNEDSTLVNALLYHCQGSLPALAESCGPALSTASTKKPAACWLRPKPTPHIWDYRNR